MFEEIMKIDSIEQAEMEAYTAIVNCVTECFHKEMKLLSRGIIPEYEIFTEAKLPKSKNSKPNILVRMWNAICRFGELIRNGIKKLFEKIKSVFSNKTIISTPDQICEVMGLNSKFTTESTIQIPTSQNSTIKLNNINVAVYPMSVGIRNNEMVIKVEDIYHHSPYATQVPGVSLGSTRALSYVISMISNTSYVDRLLELTENMKNVINNLYDTKWGDASTHWESDISKLKNEMRTGNKSEITVSQIIAFGNKFNKFTLLFSEMQNVNTPRYRNEEQLETSDGYYHYYNDLRKGFEHISELYELIPIALNVITNRINTALIIDKRYYHKISQPEIFSQFIQKLISAHIPAKYVAYNSWLVTTPEFNGYNGKYKPVWGQSRGVFFPQNRQDIVYKFALQEQGIIANRNESQITQLLQSKDIDASNLIAVIKKSYTNFTLVEQEKCDKYTGGLSSDQYKDLVNFPRRFRELRRDHSFMIVDVHEDNLGINSKGNTVIIDYGTIRRKGL